jgi:hypothetical protein
MINGFTKLWGSILTSSIWGEDNETRICWITLLALADWEGNVLCSVGGLSHAARLSKEATEKALSKFLSPDTDSRSEEFEGRRIEKIDGGYMIINFPKYRDKMRAAERRTYNREYMRRYRSGKVQNSQNIEDVNNCNDSKPQVSSVNHIDIDVDIDKDKEEEKEKDLEKDCKEKTFKTSTLTDEEKEKRRLIRKQVGLVR